MTFVITRSCCNDATCISVCPVNCIHPTPDEPDFGPAEMLYIDPDQCIDCGACVDACPVEAIAPDFDLPEGAEQFLAINAKYFQDPAHLDYAPVPVQRETTPITVTQDGALRVAIVGSGPAACYAAEALLERSDLAVEVSMFERLPVPWGLVRYGVAPDHQQTKAVTKLFERTARRPDMAFYLNVEIGTHVSHDELLTRHHAVIYAVGAAHDRSLGIPGEHLRGSHSATEFVGWYNGHPDLARTTFDLSCERAVIIGNGNVALDVARVLVSDVDELAKTDIAEHALETLAASNISEVMIIGRRGPAQAAYTISEMLSLNQVPTTEVVAYPEEAELDALTRAQLNSDPYSMAHVKAEIIKQLPSAQAKRRRAKRIVMRYRLSPVGIEGDASVQRVRLVRNHLAVGTDGVIVAEPTTQQELLDCGLVLRSVGYRGRPIAGLPFDGSTHRVPTRHGRVVREGTDEPVTGVYATGWIKRGPTGFIGTNKQDAQDTVDALLDDYAHDRLRNPQATCATLDELIGARQPAALRYQDWQVIDKHERSAPAGGPRPRIKLVTVEEMLKVAGRV